MTDINDKDRLDLLSFATWVANDPENHGYLFTRASQIILATVGAPAPTIAEELRHIAENSPVWTIQNVCDEIESTATRAEQVEKERDEARAEVDRLTAEVKTLAAENSDLRNSFTAVQKKAESTALPNPADVKPGEAWLVESGGQTVTACRLHPTSSRPWIVQRHTFGGLPFRWVADSDITLVSRLVPAPRVITNPDELDTLAEETIIRSKDGDACRKTDVGDWSVDGLDGSVGYGPRQVLPATVLREP